MSWNPTMSILRTTFYMLLFMYTPLTWAFFLKELYRTYQESKKMSKCKHFHCILSRYIMHLFSLANFLTSFLSKTMLRLPQPCWSNTISAHRAEIQATRVFALRCNSHFSSLRCTYFFRFESWSNPSIDGLLLKSPTGLAPINRMFFSKLKISSGMPCLQ